MTREQCDAVLELVANGKSLGAALREVGGFDYVHFWRAKKKWPELEELWQEADRANAEVMFDRMEEPVKLAMTGRMSVEVAKLAIDNNRWRLMIKHKAKFAPKKELDVTSDGKALPAAAVTFMVGRDVVQRVKAEDDLDAGTDEA